MEKATKHKNFKRIAEARTEKVLDMLDLIGNLSNTSFMNMTKKKLKLFLMLFKSQLKKTRRNLIRRKAKTSRRFTL